MKIRILLSGAVCGASLFLCADALQPVAPAVVDVVGGQVTLDDGRARFVRTEPSKGESRFSLQWSFDSSWEENTYVFMPAVAYNGNRDFSRRAPDGVWPLVISSEGSGLNPKLEMSGVPSLESDGSGQIEVTSADLSVPCAGFFFPKARKGVLVFTEQQFAGLNLGYTVSRGQIRIDCPARRSVAYRTANRRVPAPDPKLEADACFAASVAFRTLAFDAADVSAFLDRFLHERKGLLPGPRARSSFAEVWKVTEKFWNEDAWNGTFYAPERATKWSAGWVGGFSTVYALACLSSNETVRARCASTIDFAVSRQSARGFFPDQTRGKPLVKMPWLTTTRPVHSIRASADALYFLVKCLRVLPAKESWKAAARKGADALVDVWERHGQLGKWIDLETGAILVGRSDSAAIAPAALAEAYAYFGDKRYLEVACAVLDDFCRRDLDRGVTYGGPIDIMMAPDSESVASLLESSVRLAEITGERRWVDEARKAAALLSTWTVSYPFAFPKNSEFARLGVNAVGSVFASVQNKHSAPGLCTLSSLSLLKLSKMTGDPVYRELGLDIAAFIPQVMGRADRPIRGWDGLTLLAGHINERVNTSDWEGFERVGELFCMRCWCNTALILSLAEVPEAFER